jgi:hypothetical protein
METTRRLRWWAGVLALLLSAPAIADAGVLCAPGFRDGAEDGPLPFTTAGSDGANPWTIAASLPHDGAAAWFVPDQATVQDQRLATVTEIVSPQRLSFWKSHEFESSAPPSTNAYDGMVLEYSTDRGASWFDMLDGNGGTVPPNPARFLQNGYTHVVNPDFLNPLGGRAAWSGSSGGYHEVVVDLTDFAAESVRFRFRFGSDALVARPGGHVDDVEVRACHAKGDFSQDGQADLLWRHDASGQNVLWYMDGVTLQAGVFTNPAVLEDVRWRMVGTADFDLDRKTDILWRHATSGENVVWFMNGADLVSGTFTTPPALADTRWQMVGTGDFDRDRHADILWRHDVSGENVVWFMNGTVLVSGTFLDPASLADTDWKMAGVADFNRDGHADILWRHQVAGENVLWYMNGTALVSGTFIPSLADTQWRMSAVGDFSHDGRPDIVWRHDLSGENVVWFMGGADGSVLVVGGFTDPAALADTRWRIVGPR